MEKKKKKQKTYRYTRLFKQEVLSEIRKENLTIKEASIYYGVSQQSIYYWLKKKKIPTPKREVFYVSLSKKHDIVKENEELKKKISKLEKALSKLSMKNIFLETTIEVAEKELNIDIKKNSGS